jgi:pimeloyl-ACP methyl ester carboxylesterase
MFNGRKSFTRLFTPILDALMRRGALHKVMIEGQYASSFEESPEFLAHMHELYGKQGEASSLLRLFSNWDSFAPLDKQRYPDGAPPLHLIWGAENRVLPVERGREVSNSLRPASFDVIEGGGHLVMREKPEEISRRIEALL